jgi:hypothetical protein
MRDVPLALEQVRKVLSPQSVFVLEHANKRNLKAMLRYATKRQDWNPYTRAPHEFLELNIDFHPDYVTDELESANFEVLRRLPVSYFRLGALKNTVPTNVLVFLDQMLQHSTLFYSPSIFTKNIAVGQTEDNTAIELSDHDALFVAPGTGNPLRREGDTMVDTVTGTRWAVRDGIYDFKTPLE